MSETDRADTQVQSVARALEVLHRFIDGEDHGITELATATGLRTSTVQRLVQTMVNSGWLEQRTDRPRYRLSLMPAALGHVAVQGFGHSRAAETLAELRTQLGTGVSFGVPGHDAAYLLLQLPQDTSVTGAVAARPAGPAHICAMARLFIAEGSMSAPVSSTVPYKQFTEHTITHRAALDREVDHSRERGYAVSVDEYLDGVTSVAVPVRDAHGVVAALSAEGATQRFDPAFVAATVGALQAAAPRFANQI